MYTADEKAEIVTIQQTAIPQMTSLDIPVTPKNYTLWYRYVGGEDLELNSVVDVMIKRKSPFTEETLNMLYEQFCESSKEAELIELREELQRLVTELNRSIGEMAGRSSGFSDTLAASAEKISDAESVQDIREIINEIIRQTRDFGTRSADMGVQFTDAQKEMTALKEALIALQSEVRRDELTGIANRKAFDEMLGKQISLSKRQKRPFSLLLVDIDHFKKVNDTHGHVIGDEILRFFARRIEKRIRKEDLAARFGGEEFTVILPETEADAAVKVAEELRRFFAKTNLTRATEPKSIGSVTISVGVAQHDGEEPAKDFIARADQALYEAKNDGRNCVKLSV